MDSLTPAQKSVQFEETQKKLLEYVKKSYDYNNYVMDKCYDGVYQKNIDTLKPKVEFLKKISGTFLKLLAYNSPKISEGQKNVMELFYILLDNIEKQADHLFSPIFRSQAQQSTNKASNFNLGNESLNEGTQNGQQISGFSNGERTLLKMKINELEKELKDLRQENERVHKTLVDVAKNQVDEYTAKSKKQQGLDATNKSILLGHLKTGISKLVVKDYNLR